MSKFEELIKLNVNDHVEVRDDGINKLNFLSWSYAWGEFKKVYPDATYEIVKYENDKGVLVPYMFDENVGYMCNTKITADRITHEMWLPVMDGRNKAMKDKAYTYTTKRGEKTVEPATMFDINKTLMRCLVKNIAMFGLGLYLYAGEDIPDDMLMQTPEEKSIKVQDIADKIVACKTEDELREVYKTNKKTIIDTADLLELTKVQGGILKGKVA